MADSHPGEDGTGPADSELCEILVAGLGALARAGEGEAACRLAARACAALRLRNPRQWKRFNALLHRLAPMTGPIGAVRPARHMTGPDACSEP